MELVQWDLDNVEEEEDTEDSGVTVVLVCFHSGEEITGFLV